MEEAKSLVKELGISKKTIYQFFTDKDALVDAVMMAEFEKNHEKCKCCSINSTNAVEEIFLLMKHIGEDFRNLNPIIIYDMQKFHFKTFQKFQNHLHQNLRTMIAENLERGIKEGLYRETLDVEIIARFRMASIWVLFDPEVYPAEKFEIRKVFKETLELFLFGLVSPKGYKLIEKYQQQLNKK